VADAIIETASGCSGVEAEDLASGGSSDTDKRRQPESVVTLPAPLPKKCFCGSGQPAAGWLRGEAESRASGTRVFGTWGRRGPRGGGGIYTGTRTATGRHKGRQASRLKEKQTDVEKKLKLLSRGLFSPSTRFKLKHFNHCTTGM
jgi:hypothetical protein